MRLYAVALLISCLLSQSLSLFNSRSFESHSFRSSAIAKSDKSHYQSKSYKLWFTLQKFITSIQKKPPYMLIPPVLLFLLSTTHANASPLNKQLISLNGPFFQGWLIRMIDHKNSLSFIFIVGSFSKYRSNIYDEHYVFCGISSPSYNNHIESFPSPSSVTITSSKAPSLIPIINPTLANITWMAHGLGSFTLTDQQFIGDFIFKDHFHISFNSTGRYPWNKDNHHLFDGPEGWLGTSTVFLPCHYYVHSVGSHCSYRIRLANRSPQDSGVLEGEVVI